MSSEVASIKGSVVSEAIEPDSQEQQNESTGVGKTDVPQLQGCEAQARGASDLQGSAA